MFGNKLLDWNPTYRNTKPKWGIRRVRQLAYKHMMLGRSDLFKLRLSWPRAGLYVTPSQIKVDDDSNVATITFGFLKHYDIRGISLLFAGIPIYWYAWDTILAIKALNIGENIKLDMSFNATFCKKL